MVFCVAYLGALPLTSAIVQYAVYKLTCQNPLLVLLFCCRYIFTVYFFVLEKDDEARERDQMRYERHKDRARERNLSRAAPDKRY